MQIGTHNKTRFSDGPRYEWHDFSYLQSARSQRGAAAALFLILWIAIADLCWQRMNLSILYVVPLLLLARTGNVRLLWRTTLTLIVLTYGVYFVKHIVNPTDPDRSLIGYRIVNRTLVTATLLAMTWVLQFWIRWREDQTDAELPESFRQQDEEVSSTFAMLCCAPLVALIAAVDLVSPANFNLAILYPVPLLICGWTRSRLLLWGMLAVLLVLAVIAFYLGPPPMSPTPIETLQRNRALSAAGMIVVTLILHYWTGRQEVRED